MLHLRMHPARRLPGLTRQSILLRKCKSRITKRWARGSSPRVTGGAYPSDRNGRVIKASIASSTLVRPARIGDHGGGDRHLDALLVRHFEQDRRGEDAFRQLAAGRRRIAFAERDAEGESCATAALEQVRIRSPSPDRPVIVSARAPNARPKRNSSAKPRVISAAAALAPSPRPATMPAAIASTFLAAPPISTPRTSVE